MDGYQQSYYVAVYQTRQRMDAVVAQDQAKEAQAKSRRKYGK